MAFETRGFYLHLLTIVVTNIRRWRNHSGPCCVAESMANNIYITLLVSTMVAFVHTRGDCSASMIAVNLGGLSRDLGPGKLGPPDPNFCWKIWSTF